MSKVHRSSPREPVQTDSLDCYLDEITRIPLLSAAQERALLEQVAAGNQSAKVALTQANLRLVVSIARSYAHYGVPLLDLIQEGSLGLLHAVDKFDLTKGRKFSTYAISWIRQGILRALSTQRQAIRLPEYQVSRLRHLARTEEQLAQLLAREPDDEELATALGSSPTTIQVLRSVRAGVLSLDAPYGTDEAEYCLLDCLAYSQASTADALAVEDLAQQERAAGVKALLTCLPERERLVVVLHLGLLDATHPHTYSEIGAVLGVSRERVRQLYQRALTTLRSAYAADAALFLQDAC